MNQSIREESKQKQTILHGQGPYATLALAEKGARSTPAHHVKHAHDPDGKTRPAIASL
ncbi:MAG TPA: hypothetical protein VFW23_01685 [Tepidisphaeraceae bacterium]|nr:hypothetical protein [Tepidisphaeraceae bacterium]